LSDTGDALDSRQIARWLAVFLPVMIVTVSLLGLSLSRLTPDDGKSLVNVGQVMNGEQLSQGIVAEMEEQLDAHPRQLVVLGSSYAYTNIDPAALAHNTELKPLDIAVFSIPNSVSSHWYAVMEHRMYDRGHAVPFVFIVSSLRSLLVSQPYSPASYGNLKVHLTDQEPVLDRYVRRAPKAVEHLKEQRMALRDLVGRGLATWTAPLYGSGQHEARTSLQRVFHDSKLDHSTHKPLLLTDTTRDLLLAKATDDFPAPEDSLLPELARLAEAHGTRIVFVRTPMAPRTPVARQDLVAPGTEERVRRILERHGHLYIDAWTDPPKGLAFRDLKHMTPKSATRFTRHIASEVSKVAAEANP